VQGFQLQLVDYEVKQLLSEACIKALPSAETLVTHLCNITIKLMVDGWGGAQ
jgi:hypothetical protein